MILVLAWLHDMFPQCVPDVHKFQVLPSIHLRQISNDVTRYGISFAGIDLSAGSTTTSLGFYRHIHSAT